MKTPKDTQFFDCARTGNEILVRRKPIHRLERKHHLAGTWIFGPAGTGKTTLVDTYLQHNRRPHVYLKADHFSHDTETFYNVLTKAVKASGFNCPNPEPSEAAPDDVAASVSITARRYFNGLYSQIGEPAVFVFDNLEKLDADSPIFVVLLNALQISPEHIHFIFVSRQEPSRRFVRLIADDRMYVVGWESLRFTMDETRALVAKSAAETAPPDVAQNLYVQTKGCVALMQMGLQAHLETAGSSKCGLPARELINLYIEAELWDPLPKQHKDFLLRIGMLAVVPTELVPDPTTACPSDLILADLCRNPLLMERKEDGTYAFGPLFHDFLLERSLQAAEKNKPPRIVGNALKFFIHRGRFSEAVNLYCRLHGKIQTDNILEAYIRSILLTGDIRSAKALLSVLPDDAVPLNPWVKLAKFACCPTAEPQRRFQQLNRCHGLFLQSGDETGKRLSLNMLFETALSMVVSLSVNDLKELFAKLPNINAESIPSGHEVLCAKLIHNAICLIVLTMPSHRRLRSLEQQASALVNHCKSKRARQLAARSLAWQYLALNDLPTAKYYFDTADAACARSEQSPQEQVQSSLWMSIYSWLTGKAQEGGQYARQGLATARAKGFSRSAFFLQCHTAVCDLCAHNAAGARKRFNAIEQALPAHGRLERFVYHALAFWHAFQGGMQEQSAAHLEDARHAARMCPSLLIRAAIHTLNAVFLYRYGETDRAGRRARAAIKYNRLTGVRPLQFASYLIGALIDLKPEASGNNLTNLKKALRLGKMNGYHCAWPGHGPHMSDLLAKALDEGIEVDYAGQLVGNLPLNDGITRQNSKNWPYPIRIYVLDRFGLIVDAEPVSFSSRATAPLLLLKALISLGRGKSIAKQDLRSSIWPFMDDKSTKMHLKINVHRLRKILGYNDAVKAINGRLVLNTQMFWVDIWAIDDWLRETEKQLAGQQVDGREEAKALKIAFKLMDNMTSRFIPEIDDKWAISCRQTLKRRFLNCVTAVGSHFESKLRWMDAAHIYSRALNYFPEEQLLYQKLIQCYQRVGLRSMAISTLNLCKEKLADIGYGEDFAIEARQLSKSILTSPGCGQLPA